jgi:hypothetical protein
VGRAQCGIGCTVSGFTRSRRNREALELTFKMINAETQLLYSSDYPHWDMDLPSTIYDLPFVSEQGKRNILGGNAQRVSNLDPVLLAGQVGAAGGEGGSASCPETRLRSDSSGSRCRASCSRARCDSGGRPVGSHKGMART